MNKIEQGAPFLSRRDLAARWGVCWLTVRRMEKAGKLPPSVQIGARARFSRTQIEAFESLPTRQP